MHKPQYSLFQRSNRIWYILINHSSKRVWKSTRCTRKHDAEQVLHELIAQQNSDAIQEISRDCTFEEYSKKFLHYGKQVYRPSTLEIYERVFKLMKLVVGEIGLQKVTTFHWDEFIRIRTGEVNSQSLNIELRALRCAFNKAVDWNLLQISPFRKAVFPKLIQRAPKYLTKAEFKLMLSKVKENWFRDAMIFAASTGIRKGEMINLKWTDLNLERRIIDIQSDDYFTVKGGKMRIVPLSATALEVIQRQQKIEGVPYIFSLNGKQLYCDWLSRLFRRYLDQSGLKGRGLHWHNLRSTFASWLVESGVSIYSVSKLLGHSSVTLTQKHYARLSPESLHHEVEKISIGSF